MTSVSPRAGDAPGDAPQRASLVDQVIAQLRAQIGAGTWPVGTRIPTEPELTESLQVGRNTVREAVRALIHAGILESRQGAGTFVRAQSELAGAVHRLVAERGNTDIVEVRRALEVEAARLAAARRTREDLRRLRQALRARDAAWESGDLEAFASADVEFHSAVVAASHNAVLAQLYAELEGAVRASIRASSCARSQGFVDHAGLADALESGDPERAMREAGTFLEDQLTGPAGSS